MFFLFLIVVVLLVCINIIPYKELGCGIKLYNFRDLLCGWAFGLTMVFIASLLIVPVGEVISRRDIGRSVAISNIAVNNDMLYVDQYSNIYVESVTVPEEYTSEGAVYRGTPLVGLGLELDSVSGNKSDKFILTSITTLQGSSKFWTAMGYPVLTDRYYKETNSILTTPEYIRFTYFSN